MIRRMLRVAVPALARGDAERLLRFVGEAEGLGGDQPFTGDLLVELGRLVEADSVFYQEHDCVPRPHLVEVQRTGDDPLYYIKESCVLYLDTPIRQRRGRGNFGALKISDFQTRRELHGTRFYDVVLRQYGFEHELEIDIPSPPLHWKTFFFDRAEQHSASATGSCSTFSSPISPGSGRPRGRAASWRQPSSVSTRLRRTNPAG